MESVIARATGNADAEFKKVPVLQNQLLRMELDAEQILGKPLTKLKNQKLPQDGIYKRYGATSGVPKQTLLELMEKQDTLSKKVEALNLFQRKVLNLLPYGTLLPKIPQQIRMKKP